MRVVVLTNQQSNQTALVNKIGRVADVVGVILSENIPRKQPAFGKRARIFANRIANRTAGRKFVETWTELLAKYDSLYAELPATDITRVRNINDGETIATIERLDPDLVVVSGTNIVGRAVIEAGSKRRGVVNLHTGISPYVRGGPNCTNWCLARNWFHLIGNTVMWIDAGVDTGNIIATERTPLTGSESLLDLHWAVMEHAHDLYVRTIDRISGGGELRSADQSGIAAGSDFRNSDWTATEMRRALRNFETGYRDYFNDAERQRSAESSVRLFPL